MVRGIGPVFLMLRKGLRNYTYNAGKMLLLINIIFIGFNNCFIPNANKKAIRKVDGYMRF
jgi:hypothetical protein